MGLQLRTVFIFFILITLMFGVIQAQDGNVIDCEGMIVYNYNVSPDNPIAPIAREFRNDVIENLNCNIIDHTMDATLIALLEELTPRNQSEIDSLFRTKYSSYQKTMFLVYQKFTRKNWEGKDEEAIRVRVQIRSKSGLTINDKHRDFDLKNISLNAPDKKKQALIQAFVNDAMNRKSSELSSFESPNRTHVLVANFRDLKNCPNSIRKPEQSIKNFLERSEYGDYIEVVIDNDENDVMNSADAILRGAKKGADIVVWSREYNDYCDKIDKAYMDFELLGNDKQDFLDSRMSERMISADELSNFTMELGRIVYWLKGRYAMQKKDWKNAQYFLKRLPDSILTNKEKVEKYFLLGSMRISPRMTQSEFITCKRYFNICIDVERDNFFRMEWLQILKSILAVDEMRPSLRKMIDDEYSKQAIKLLKSLNPASSFPSNRDEFLFCLSLAKDKRLKEILDQPLDFLIDNENFNSPGVLKEKIKYLDVYKNIRLAKGQAEVMCRDYPQNPFGYQYLSEQFEKDSKIEEALSYALKAKKFGSNNAELNIRLAKLYLKKNSADSCRYYYLMGIYLDPSLKEEALEKKLGLFNHLESGNPSPKKLLTYTVKNPNQSFKQILDWIGEKFGEDMKQKVKKLNFQYDDDDIIKKNEKMILYDGSSELTYTVKLKDNVNNIKDFLNKKIRNLDVSSEDIISLNGLPGGANNPMICPNQILIIKKGMNSENRLVTFNQFLSVDEIVTRLNQTETKLKHLNGESECKKKCWIIAR